MAVPFGAGCTQASSEQPVEAETQTPIDNEASRRDVVGCYAEGVGAYEDGRTLLIDGNAALEDGDHRAAADEFERAGTAFDDALAEFERAYEIVSWLDLDDREERTAQTILEDAGQRTSHHLEAAAALREAAVQRVQHGSGAGGDRLESAREELDAASDHPMRDPDTLATTLSVDGG